VSEKEVQTGLARHNSTVVTVEYNIVSLLNFKEQPFSAAMPYFEVTVTNLHSIATFGVLESERDMKLSEMQALYNCGYTRNSVISYYVTSKYIFVYLEGILRMIHSKE
jgi:hypothetical protein